MASPTPADIRSWARDNGFVMPDRGPLSAEVKTAYAKAHRAGAKATKSATVTAATARSKKTAKPSPVVRKAAKARQAPVARHAVKTSKPVMRRALKTTPNLVDAVEALAGTVADLSRRVIELENHVIALRARPVPAKTLRLGRRR